MKRLFAGTAMMAVCLVYILLFIIPGYRDFYANTPAAFLTVTVSGMVFSIAGSYMVRDALNGGINKDGVVPGILRFIGELVVIAGVLAGLVSLYGALTLGMIEGYWGWDWGKRYYFSYHVNSAANPNISLLSVSMVVTIIGQFMIGYGHKRTPAGR